MWPWPKGHLGLPGARRGEQDPSSTVVGGRAALRTSWFGTEAQESGESRFPLCEAPRSVVTVTGARPLTQSQGRVAPELSVCAPCRPWNLASHLTHASAREQEVSSTLLASLAGLRGKLINIDEQKKSTRMHL